MSSRGQVQPWTIDHVFLFEAQALINELKRRDVKIGIATSIRQLLWTKAEIYPNGSNPALVLSEEQRKALSLFNVSYG